MIIAAASLRVAYDANLTNRELVTAASWPFVQFFDDEPVDAKPRVLTFVVSNDGMGPAKLLQRT